MDCHSKVDKVSRATFQILFAILYQAMQSVGEQTFVNFTVVVHYRVNKLDHPPQYHGCLLTYLTLLSVESIGCCERLCQMFRRIRRSRIHSANQQESMQDDGK